jgi:hypothetical protein
VLDERIFFRNIPLSAWVEYEMPVEQGADLEKLARATSATISSRLHPARENCSDRRWSRRRQTRGPKVTTTLQILRGA